MNVRDEHGVAWSSFAIRTSLVLEVVLVCALVGFLGSPSKGPVAELFYFLSNSSHCSRFLSKIERIVINDELNILYHDQLKAE